MQTPEDLKARLYHYKENQMRKLDNQGRHRSEWCYAQYDDRCKEEEIPWGAGYETLDT